MGYNKNFEDLLVWQKSLALTKDIYHITKIFPKEEQYGLVTQMRRCAVSIPSNIAEGAARNSVGEFIQFIGIASGSCAELYTQLVICRDITLIGESSLTQLGNQAQEIGRMLNGLKSSLRNEKPKLATNN